jgi:lysophospholipase L1-like esterase
MKQESVFIIGDSISLHYGPYLKQYLGPNFTFHRTPGEQAALIDLDQPVGGNGGDSKRVLEVLKEEQAVGAAYGLLLFNCGLHDLKTDPVTKEKQVAPERYAEHLHEIVASARQLATRLIWMKTTPVVDVIHAENKEGFLRYNADVLRYNGIADEVMRLHEVPAIDLYTLTAGFGEEAYCDHVHFKEHVRALQGAYIAGFVAGHY